MASVENHPAPDAVASDDTLGKLLFVSWAPFCSRSDTIARLLGGTSHMIYADFKAGYAIVWFKYLVQMWRTWKLLRTERPRTVIVMVPPIFACIPVYFYCLLSGAQFVTDTHTAALSQPRWQKLFFLSKWIYRRAATNIITNEYLAEIARGWGATVTIVGDLPVSFARIGAGPQSGDFPIAVPCSFNPDEPLDNLWQAARELSDVNFFVTGRVKDLDPKKKAERPPNLYLTDFLDNESYAGLIAHSKATLVLTTRDHTMQRGAYESVSMGTPVITSDFPLLRETFGGAALFVDNSPASIVAAVRTIQRDWPSYKAAVEQHRQKRLEVWKSREQELRARLRRT